MIVVLTNTVIGILVTCLQKPEFIRQNFLISSLAYFIITWLHSNWHDLMVTFIVAPVITVSRHDLKDHKNMESPPIFSVRVWSVTRDNMFLN